MTSSRLAVSGVALAAWLLAGRPARAYDFEVEATSTGQGYQVRWFRFRDPEMLLNRRRFTQSLRLHVWDILAPDSGQSDKPAKAPFDLYFTSSFRFDHDFGSYVRGAVTYPLAGVPVTDPAKTVVPELAANDHQLDVLYAYVGGRGLFGFVDFQLGRQLGVDTLEWFAFDGLRVAARTPFHVRLVGHGGLVVREQLHVLGSGTEEPDGTGSAQCATFEPAAGTWLEADECAQRKQLMPTFGFAAETYGLAKLQARLAYRRSVSPTPSGLYPDDNDQAPSWGVNEEKLVLSLRGNLAAGGIVPWAAGRWNFALAQIDEAQAGVRFGMATLAVTPEYVYSFPSFDADSIFNVFSTEPYQDFRLTVDAWPQRGRLRAYARATLRRFENSDTDTTVAGAAVSASAYSVGGRVGARVRFSDRAAVRTDLFHEDGFGGMRSGVDVSGHVQLRRDFDLEGRATLIDFADDLLPGLEAVTFGAEGGAMWTLTEGVALHLLAEENANRFTSSQFRLLAVLDLAFRPEL